MGIGKLILFNCLSLILVFSNNFGYFPSMWIYFSSRAYFFILKHNTFILYCMKLIFTDKDNYSIPMYELTILCLLYMWMKHLFALLFYPISVITLKVTAPLWCEMCIQKIWNLPCNLSCFLETWSKQGPKICSWRIHCGTLFCFQIHVVCI